MTTTFTALDGPVTLIKRVSYASGSARTIIGSRGGLYAYDGTTMSVLNNETLTCPDGERWVADFFNKRWEFCNRSDGLLEWDGVNPVVKIDTGTPELKGRILCQFANHLLMANLESPGGDGAYTFAGCGLPTSTLLSTGETTSGGTSDWNAEEEKSEAELREIPDDATPILAICRGAGMAIIWKSGSIHLMSYIGLPLVYDNPESQVPDVGLLAPASVVGRGTEYGYVGTDNLYMFNGSSNIGFGVKIWRWWVKEEMLASLTGWIYGWRDGRYSETMWVYQALVTSVQRYVKALIYSEEYDAFSTRDFPFSAVGYTDRPSNDTGTEGHIPTFDELTMPMDEIGVLGTTAGTGGDTSITDLAVLAGDQDGNLFIMDDTDDTADGVAINAILESGDDCCDDPDNVKVCDGMDLDVTGLEPGETIDVYVSARMDLSDAIVYDGPYGLTMPVTGSLPRWVDFFAVGKWFRWKFVSQAGYFELSGYGPRVQMAGRY